MNLVSTRNTALDGLRGYAAIMVAVFHCVLGVDHDLVPRVLTQDFSDMSSSFDRLNWLVLRTFNGGVAVSLFFVLSGTVLFDSLRRAHDAMPILAIRFLIRRFFRIYPQLLICLVVTASAYMAFGLPVTPRGFFENALLYSYRINGATWTLFVELAAAPLMLLAFFGYRIAREAGLLVTGLLLVLVIHLLVTRSHTDSIQAANMKAFWPHFLIGMLIPTRIGRKLAELLPRFSWMIIIPILLYRIGLTTERICAGLLVAMLYYGRGGALGAFLAQPVSSFLGKISYSFYLYNVLFLEIICDWLRRTPLGTTHPLTAGLAAAVVVVVCTIPVAWIASRWIEKPFNRLGHVIQSPKTGAAGQKPIPAE